MKKIGFDIKEHELRYVDIDELKFDGDNPNKMTEEQLESLQRSMEEFGYLAPVVVDEDYVVADGEHRVKAYKDFGKVKIPAYVVKFESDEHRKLFRQVANKLRGEHDEELDELEVKKILNAGLKQDLKQFLKTDKSIERIIEDLNKVELSKGGKLPDKLSEWKILNLYAGIGGNRKFWGNLDITHVEYNEKIAKALQKMHPNDKVIVADAHQYLLEHFQEFDFIWSSPPCPTHSRMRKNFNNKPVYPDLKLYEEILFLQGYFNGLWVVENVKSWYNPLIEPQERGRHYYWANFSIPEIIINKPEIGKEMLENVSKKTMIKKCKEFGIPKKHFKYIPNISNYPKDKIIRNIVHPKAGEIILKAAFKQQVLNKK